MWKVCSLLFNSCFRWYLLKVTEFWKQHVPAHSRARESCRGTAEVASSFPCAEVGPSPLFFSPAATLSLCPQSSCLCIGSHGKRVLRGSLEKFAATRSFLRVKGPDDPAFLVGRQSSHPFAVRTCGFKHWTQSTDEPEWVKGPNRWFIWE